MYLELLIQPASLFFDELSFNNFSYHGRRFFQRETGDVVAQVGFFKIENGPHFVRVSVVESRPRTISYKQNKYNIENIRIIRIINYYNSFTYLPTQADRCNSLSFSRAFSKRFCKAMAALSWSSWSITTLKFSKNWSVSCFCKLKINIKPFSSYQIILNAFLELN